MTPPLSLAELESANSLIRDYRLNLENLHRITTESGMGAVAERMEAGFSVGKARHLVFDFFAKLDANGRNTLSIRCFLYTFLIGDATWLSETPNQMAMIRDFQRLRTENPRNYRVYHEQFWGNFHEFWKTPTPDGVFYPNEIMALARAIFPEGEPRQDE